MTNVCRIISLLTTLLVGAAFAEDRLGPGGQNQNRDERTSTTKPATAPGVVPVGDIPVGELVWHDEFERHWPDPLNWRPGEIEKANGNHKAPGTNSELQFYQLDRVGIGDGLLKLEAVKRAVKVIKVGEDDARKDTFEKRAGTDQAPDLYYWPYYAGVFNYQSGWASTGPDKYGMMDHSSQRKPALHEFTFGYFEFRAKMPRGKGMWPAIWMLRSDQANLEEIDVLEMVDEHAQRIAQHYHYGTKAAPQDWSRLRGQGYDQHVDLSQDFHTYGLLWTKDELTWYIDGHKTQSTLNDPKFNKADICRSPMYLIFNLAIGGWAGAPDESTAFPQWLQIDYVRVWKPAP